jgi:hypothetical protein
VTEKTGMTDLLTANLRTALNEKDMTANKDAFDNNWSTLRMRSVHLQKATQLQPLDRTSWRRSRILCSLERA